MAITGQQFQILTIFVQVSCAMGRTYEIAARIVDEVAECGELFSTSGDYDLIARFNLPSSIDPGVFVSGRLQAIDGITATNTILAFNAFTPPSG